MNSVNLADATARLRELVDLAEAGEVINITRRGNLVAQLMPVAKTRELLDMEAIRRLTGSSPFADEPAGDFMRRIRDEARYGPIRSIRPYWCQR